MQDWIITEDKDDGRRGCLTGALLKLDCALGRSGVIAVENKTEGDGATPLGRYPVRRVFYRPDKITPPICHLPLDPITPAMGWCDAADHPSYNQLIEKPFGPSHELLWRGDDLYDLILVIGHNDDPPIVGKGSAIFLHVTRGAYEPTEGCASFKIKDFKKLISMIKRGDHVVFARC